MIVAASTAHAAAAAPLRPSWTREFDPADKASRFLALAPSGQCLAVAHGGVLEVLRPNGEVWWTWPYAKVSRFIQPYRAALSADCNAIVVPGNSGYRYSWIVRRGGSAAAIKTTATPQSVAFDRTGRSAVIGTGGGALQRHALDGSLEWTLSFGAFSILDDLAFSADNRSILIGGWYTTGVVSADGRLLWDSTAEKLRAARDHSHFLAINQGRSIISSVELLDGTHASQWRRYADTAAFVSAGGRVLAAVDLKQDKQPGDEAGPVEQELRLLSREGQTIAAFPGYSKALALSEDGTRMWLRKGLTAVCVSERGDVLAEAALPSVDFTSVELTERWDAMVIAFDHYASTRSVGYYEVPASCRQ